MGVVSNGFCDASCKSKQFANQSNLNEFFNSALNNFCQFGRMINPRPASFAIKPASDQSFRFPIISYGPLRLLECLPWLFVATYLRIVAYSSPGLALFLLALSMACILMAFLAAVRATVEFIGGQTQLGQLTFGERLGFVKKTMRWWFVITIIAMMAVGLITRDADIARSVLLGIDGMAFDTRGTSAKFWTPIITILFFFAAMLASNRQEPSFYNVIDFLKHHMPLMVVTYSVLVMVLLGLSPIQAYFRELMMEVRQTSLPLELKNVVSVGFVFFFASLRLWVTLFILTTAFKQSCELLEAKSKT